MITLKKAKELAIAKWESIVEEMQAEINASDGAYNSTTKLSYISLSYWHDRRFINLHSLCGLCEYTYQQSGDSNVSKNCHKICPLPALDNGRSCWDFDCLYDDADTLVGAQKMLETIKQIKTE